MKKILLSIFLAVSMLLTNISVMAEENAGTEYSDAVKLLSSLNIISVYDTNDDFSDKTYVTREEFCVYLSRAFKIEPDVNAKQIFSDVPADSELAHYISTLYDRGVVSGYGGAFRPRDIITYNEAVKLLVSIMNYDYAGEIGGYPSGYLRIASSLGITEDVYGVDRLTKGAAAQLIFNAMSAPLMEITGIKDGNITFKTNNDKSVLTELYSMYEGEGVVLANGNATFTSGAESLETDEVLIEDTVYKVGKTDVANRLGHYIEFLYLEVDDDEFEVIMVTEDEGEEFVITGNQLISFEDNVYKYEDEEGKVKKVRLNSDFLVMYNFDYPISSFEPEMMEPDMGRIKLIKSGKGSGYSAVIIEEYVNHVVSSVDAEAEVIYSKGSPNIDLKGKEYLLLDTDGKEISLSAVKEWNIASVLTGGEGNKVVIYISDKMLEGKPSRVGNVTSPEVIIDSDKYFVDTNVISNIEIAKNAVFYLDYNGVIAGMDKAVEGGLRYAYLMSAKLDNSYDKYDEDRVYVKLFDQDGTEKRYYLANNVKINDVRYKENAEGIVNSALVLSEKIIKYQLNNSGEINTIYVYDATSDKYIRQLFSGGAYWNQKQRSFGGKVTMEADVPVFVVPEGASVEDYQVVGLNSFENDKYTTVKIFTMGDNVYGDVILRDTINTSYTRPLAVVNEVIHMLDEYGDISIKVSLFYNGSAQEFTLSKEEVLGDVDKGDIVKISLDNKNRIQAFLHIYDFSEQTFLLSNPYQPDSGAGYRSKDRCLYGYAYDITDGLLRCCKVLPSGAADPDTENALLSAFRIYVIDGPEVRIGNENDLKGYTEVGNNCSEIVVHTMWGDPEDIVIIKH